MKKLLSLLTLLIVAIGTSWATETAVSLVSYTVSENTATCTNSDDENVTIVLSRPGGKLPNPDSKSDRGLRWQKNAVVTATVPTGYKINSVKLTSGKNGNSVGQIVYTVTDGTSSLTGTWDNALNSSDKKDSYTWTAGTGVTTTSWVLTNTGSTGDLYFSAVTVTYEATATTAPEITTDLAATADVTVGVAEDFSIVATGATSYQWYKDDVAIEGATAATYSYTAAAAGTVNIKCVASNTYGDTPSTVCAVTATAPANPPVITTNLEAAYNVNKGSTLELSIVAEDASSYQWYVDGAAVAGATSDSYTYSATTIGNVAVYCAATNAAGTTNSATATVTTVGSSACKLINVKYSNGFYAWITQPYTDKDGNDINTGVYTIDSYYMEGEAVPTIDESSIEVSANATWAIADGKLTVTAEDETTKSVFTINEPVAVTPLEGSGNYTMYASDTYVKARYGYKNESGKIGWGMAKSTEEDVNPRISSGNSRMTIFLAEGNTKLTIKGSSTSDRNVDVFVNGTQVVSNTKLAKNGGTVDINLTAANASMVVISNRGNGDLHIQSITITPETAPATETITVDGVATYITKNALDFTSVTGLTAYAVTGVNDAKTSVTTEAVTTVPAGTALLVKGATADVPVVASAGDITNLLKESNGTVKGADNVFAYSKSALKFKKVATTVTIPAGKAYLVIEGVSGDALDLDFEGEATAVDAIAEADEAEAAPVKVIKNGKLYIGNFNVAGQQVK